MVVEKIDLRIKIDLGTKTTSHLFLFFKLCDFSGEPASILLHLAAKQVGFRNSPSGKLLQRLPVKGIIEMLIFCIKTLNI